MATALKLKNDINKLKAALRSKATPKSFLPKLKSQLEKAEADYETVKAGKKSAPKASKQVKSTMDKLKAIIKKKKYGAYRAQGVDLKKDADIPALPTGKRISKNGNTYYEYRANRIDVKQPPKRYPKLEDGGYMAKGGLLEIGDMVMVDDSGYVKLFSGFDTTKPAKIISKDKKKVFGKIKYFYGLEMEDGKKPFNNAQESMLTKVSKDGGYMADGGTIDNSGMTPADLQKQIWNLTARIAKLGDIESRAASYEIEMLMKQRKKLQSMALNHGDVVMAQGGELHRSQEEKFKYGGYMAGGGDTYLNLSEDERMEVKNLKGLIEETMEAIDVHEKRAEKSDDKELRSYHENKVKENKRVLADRKSRLEILRKRGMAKGGYMAEGVEIKDQYEGREPEDIWNSLSKMQRSHFLFDHASEIEARRGEDKGELKGKEISDAMKMDFDSLDKYIRITFENHIREGQYKYGGYMAEGGALEHGLKKGDHIMVVRGNMLGIKNEITGEIVTLNIETGERKESKD
jgi:hypothetical protein